MNGFLGTGATHAYEEPVEKREAFGVDVRESSRVNELVSWSKMDVCHVHVQASYANAQMQISAG